jgi:alkylation response protein AidB-like acyl-CoA dehydrogenase
VFIPIDWVIGGAEQVGNGWKMLIECLGEGCGISLLALSTGAAKLCSRSIGAYARVRQQFGLPIEQFEGIEEPLANMLGNTYLMDTARKLTTTALDHGLRTDSSVEKLATLRPFFDTPYGHITPANSSQITDGACSVLLASEDAVKRYDLSPLAKLSPAQWAGCAITDGIRAC